MEQLAILGTQIGVDTLPIVKGEKAVQIAKRAKQRRRRWAATTSTCWTPPAGCISTKS
jgi:signal recognition particle GTPase